MIHAIVHRYKCEGCGYIIESREELTEIGEHYRTQYNVGRRVFVSCEDECIALDNELRKQENVKEAEREEKRNRLIELCSRDDIFRKLTKVFPEDDGNSEHWDYFGNRMDEIAWDELSTSMTDLTRGSSSWYHLLLKQCIDSARQEGVRVDDNKIG